MNITVRQKTASQRLTIVDCDIHPAFRSPAELHPFLPARWREHMTTFGEHVRHGLTGQLPYPRMMAGGMRMDSFPEQGPPGSDLDLMRAQHLDANGVEVLYAHQVEVAARRTLLGERVHAHAARHHARIGQLPGQAMTHMLAEGRQVLAPARGQERVQLRGRAKRRMNVAVYDSQPLRRGLLAHGDIHRTVSSCFAALSLKCASSRKRG